MSKIINTGTNLYLSSLPIWKTPVKDFFIDVQPILQTSTNPSPDFPIIFYDSRKITIQIIDYFNNANYLNLFFPQFIHPADPDERAMYYGRINYDDYNGLIIAYTHVSIPGDKITWSGRDSSTDAWHGTFSEEFELPFGDEGFCENYQYVSSYSDLSSTGYEFTIKDHEIYVYDKDYNDNLEKFTQRISRCHFCYRINERHLISAIEPIYLPLLRAQIDAEPYPVTFSYEVLESNSTLKIMRDITQPQDLLNNMLTTKSNGSDGFVILDNILPLPIKDLTVDLPMIQEGEGDASPDNPRPFKIYDSIEVRGLTPYSALYTAKDMFKGEGLTNEYEDTSPNSVTGRVSAFVQNKWLIPGWLKGQTVSLGCPSNSLFAYSDGDQITHIDSTSGLATFTIPNNYNQIKFWYEGSNDSELMASDPIMTITCWISLPGNSSVSFDANYHHIIKLPPNTIGGKVNLVQGWVNNTKKVYSYLPPSLGGGVAMVFEEPWVLVNSNDCQVIWTDVSPIDPTTHEYIGERMYKGSLILPPDIRGKVTDMNGWLCSHYTKSSAGSSGTWTWGTVIVDDQTYGCVDIFDTRFVDQKTTESYIHNLDNPIYFAVLCSRSHDLEYNYFLSTISQQKLSKDFSVLKIEHYDYEIEYYIDSRTVITDLQQRVVQLEEQLKNQT